MLREINDFDEEVMYMLSHPFHLDNAPCGAKSEVKPIGFYDPLTPIVNRLKMAKVKSDDRRDN